jgi:hypothetical protein
VPGFFATFHQDGDSHMALVPMVIPQVSCLILYFIITNDFDSPPNMFIVISHVVQVNEGNVVSVLFTHTVCLITILLLSNTAKFI